MKPKHKRIRKKTDRKHRSHLSKRKKFTEPRNAEEFFAMPERLQEKWIGVTRAVTKMRTDRVSLPKAAREFGLDPRVVVTLGGSALRKHNGKYFAKVRDPLLRVEVIPTPQGLQEIGVPDSRQASLLGKYWNSVHQYLETGDASGLKELEGKQIKSADGTTILLLTDLRELDRLGSAGLLSFQSIYGRAA